MKNLLCTLLLGLLCVAHSQAQSSFPNSHSISCAAATSCTDSSVPSTTGGNLAIFAMMSGNTAGITEAVCDGASCGTCTAGAWSGTSADTFQAVPSNPVLDTVGDIVYMAYAKLGGSITSVGVCSNQSHTIRMAVYEAAPPVGMTWPATASVLEVSNTGFSATNVTTGTGET